MMNYASKQKDNDGELTSKSLIAMIPEGAENAIAGDALSSKSGIPGTELRDRVQRASTITKTPVAFIDGKYYIPTNAAEMRKFYFYRSLEEENVIEYR